FQWAWCIQGTDARDLEVLDDGTSYLVGGFQNEIDLDPGTGLNIYIADDIDSYIMKCNANGEQEWGLVLTGPSNNNAYAVTADNAGGVYVAGGYTGEMDLDPTSGEEIVTNTGSFDYFISKLNSAGEYEWGNTIHNQGDGRYYDIDFDLGSGSVSAVGTGNGIYDLPDGSEISALGGTDVFQAEFGTDGTYIGHMIMGGFTSEIMETGNAVTRNGVITVAGAYTGMIDFGPGDEQEFGPQSQGNQDMFIARYSPVSSVGSSVSVDLMLYPNPTTGLVQLSDGQIIESFLVIDATGRTVLESNNASQEINLEGLPSGVYTVSAVTSTVTVTTRVLKR
ncbi:MAG: T9SS type A sorting domain-containing protein, partial [Flavobacteriales bacterium]|nr:T9SS type A sorting domain-containing protein [Flavobacteriales bacterium]